RFSSESLAQAGITASPLPPEFLRAFPIESLPAKAPVPSSTATTAAPVEISSGKLAPDSSSFPVLPQQEELALIEDFLDRILGSAKTPESDFSPILESQKAEFSPAAAPFMARIEEALPPPNADPRNASPHDAKNPGAQKSEMSPEPAAPQNLSALTTGLTTAEGFPVLSVTNSQGGLVSFYIARSPGAEIAPGTLLRLTPLNAQEIIGTPSTALPLLTPGIWPAMTALYETLAQIAPPLAHTLRAGISNPASPTQITPAALFFMAAVTGGNLAGWLGDKTIDALRRDGRGHILSRLMEESGLMGRLTATESTGQDWRSMALPLFWDNEIHKMILHYKRDGQEDDTPEKGKQGTRFIFDLTLSAMGKIQIDGLFRSNRLDVILRSLTPFSAAMQADMRRTYVLALEETGLTGELGFQSDPSKWVTVTAEAEPFWVSA
ncbi:MAG: hypothetical protein K9G62_00375, partial [Alphaproteobacteria bacterium]|nr:hypothetical protein [Alphaproteobacteria bacterium]